MCLPEIEMFPMSSRPIDERNMLSHTQRAIGIRKGLNTCLGSIDLGKSPIQCRRVFQGLIPFPSQRKPRCQEALRCRADLLLPYWMSFAPFVSLALNSPFKISHGIHLSIYYVRIMCVSLYRMPHTFGNFLVLL